MEIIYSTSRVHSSLREGRKYVNPTFFAKPEPDAKKVYIVGIWPKVLETYRRLGVPVVVMTEAQSFVEAPPEHILNPARKKEAVEKAPQIPDKYAEMSWPELRSLASGLSSKPVVNKAQAIEVIIEAEKGREIEPEKDEDNVGNDL